MSDLNFFQTYAQRENHVTNNTLLMLRHVWRAMPARMDEVFAGLLGAPDLGIGLTFEQQKGVHGQIPDGVIGQQPFFLYIEAKRGSALDRAQIDAHRAAIAKQRHPEGSAWLLGLTTEIQGLDVAAPSSSAGADAGARVHFGQTTYADLVATLREVCGSDPELSEILDDYEAFLDAEALRPDQHRHMVAVLCGQTHKLNVETGVFFDPPDRAPKWRRAHLMGIYTNKRVGHVGRIAAVVIAQRSEASGEVVVGEVERGAPTEETRAAIERAMERGELIYPGLSTSPTRYYVVDAFHETDLRKTTPGGMMGHRYFDLSAYGLSDVTETTPVERIAEALRGKTFE